MQEKVRESIELWKGLENFRRILFDLFSIGLDNLKQETLNSQFSSYELLLEPRKKTLAKEALAKQEAMDLSPEAREELEAYKKELENFQDETIVKKETENFEYEMVFREDKEKKLSKNLQGYVKIKGKKNPNHLGLLTWESHNRPIIFLAEIKRNEKSKKETSFHINYGDSGLAIIWEDHEYYYWTHSHSDSYKDLINDFNNSEIGTVKMNKTTKEFELVDSNLAAASALSRAKAQTSSGKLLIESNVELMNIYKQDLEKFIF